MELGLTVIEKAQGEFLSCVWALRLPPHCTSIIVELGPGVGSQRWRLTARSACNQHLSSVMQQKAVRVEHRVSIHLFDVGEAQSVSARPCSSDFSKDLISPPFRWGVHRLDYTVAGAATDNTKHSRLLWNTLDRDQCDPCFLFKAQPQTTGIHENI